MAKSGLKKKYIKLADGDFKKAWKLQKAAKKKSGTNKKKTKKKTAKKKTVKIKSTVKKRKIRKKTVKKSTPKRKAGRMAKKKNTTKKRTRRRSGGGGGKIQKVLVDGAAVIGGAIGAGIAANYIPVPDQRLKAAMPIVAGVALASTKMGSSKMMQMVSLGMVAAGGLALLKQFAPNVPVLAGEEDFIDYVSPDAEERAMLGYYDQDDDDDDFDDLLGAPVEVGQDDDELEDFMGESVAVGGGDFVSTADW